MCTNQTLAVRIPSSASIESGVARLFFGPRHSGRFNIFSRYDRGLKDFLRGGLKNWWTWAGRPTYPRFICYCCSKRVLVRSELMVLRGTTKISSILVTYLDCQYIKLSFLWNLVKANEITSLRLANPSDLDGRLPLFWCNSRLPPKIEKLPLLWINTIIFEYCSIHI